MDEDIDDATQWKIFSMGLYEKKIVFPGHGPCNFLDGTKCTVVLKPSIANSQYFEDQMGICFDDETIITLGETNIWLLHVVDMCLRSMQSGEVCIMRTPISCESVQKEEDVIELEVSLISYEPARPAWEMTVSEKMEISKKLKEIGISLYKNKDLYLSFQKFNRALKYLLSIDMKSDDLPAITCTDCNQLKMVCYLNLAACQLQTNNYKAVIDNCTKALELDKDNVKGLFRRGEAFLKLGESDKAQADLDRAHNLDPANKAIARSLQTLRSMTKEQNDEIAKCFGKMF